MIGFCKKQFLMVVISVIDAELIVFAYLNLIRVFISYQSVL
jgi:hypothetical protein